MTVRKLIAEDIPFGLQLCRASGWNQVEDDWRFFLNSPGSGGFLAEKAGCAVGTVTFLRYDCFAWIAMMLVDSQQRGAGTGSRLLEQALDALKDVACVGLDATQLGERLYRRFGFVTDYPLVRTKGVIEATRFGRPDAGAHRMETADLSDVLGRDREIFGADRSQLLGSLFRRAPECAWIAKRGADLRGYMFGRPGHLWRHLGPVVAEDRGAACDLVAHCCSGLDGRRVLIDAPLIDLEWVAWLDSVGFVDERPFVRMFRRQDARPGIPARQYAITGPEFA
jgi:GNAT superfamily N-acetyltransferase